MTGVSKISSETVRADFNDPVAVVHYARAAHFLGLWKSERTLIERFFPERNAHLIEAGCGAGRVTIGLWDMGFTQLTAFDFAEELLDQARTLARDRGASGIRFLNADATRLTESARLGADGVPSPRAQSAPSADSSVSSSTWLSKSSRGEGNPPTARRRSSDTIAVDSTRSFDGALFMFNGLMQIPGRADRRKAMSQLAQICRPGAPFLFTTHDRNSSPTERVLWRLEAERWSKGEQDPKLVEFGDRYFEDASGRTFMHLPDREEILDDLAASGWKHEFDALRREIAKESRAVIDFSDECRFWAARRAR